jgi:2-hydroxychromene-2-carboxylate isomerase
MIMRSRWKRLATPPTAGRRSRAPSPSFVADHNLVVDGEKVAWFSRIAARSGLDAAELLAKVEQPAYKERLRANTDELIARGGFGSPTMFVGGDDMYFGNDRLELVGAALVRG